MAAIRERKSAGGKISWHAQVRVQGHEPQTRSFDRKTDAKAWAAETERLLRVGRFRLVNEAQARDFSELCQRFKEKYMRPSRAKDYVQILYWWEQRLGPLRLINVTSEMIQRHLHQLMASPSNARREKPAASPSFAPVPLHVAFGMQPPQPQPQPKPKPKPKPKRLASPLRKHGTKAAEPKLTSVGTGLRYLAVLSRVLNCAVKQLAWLDRSPVLGVERPRQEEIKAPHTLEPPEEERLLARADVSANRALRIVVRIALRTGMRLNEIMRLRWNDIKFHEGYAMILVKKTKNKRQRTVPLVGDAFTAVVSLRFPLGDAFSDSLLFPSKKDHEKPVSIRSAWNTCLKQAGVAEFRFHDLRHTLASRLARDNNSLPRIGNVLGHVDHRSTMIYMHFATDDAVQMVKHSAQASAAAIAKLDLSTATESVNAPK